MGRLIPALLYFLQKPFQSLKVFDTSRFRKGFLYVYELIYHKFGILSMGVIIVDLLYTFDI